MTSPFKGIGQPLCGPSDNIHYIKGDGNCYFQAISFYISGQEEYHKEVGEMICDYIKFFPGRLSALISREYERKNGWAYIKRTGMNKVGEWATEVEILATAKCLKREYHNISQRQMAEIFLC